MPGPQQAPQVRKRKTQPAPEVLQVCGGKDVDGGGHPGRAEQRAGGTPRKGTLEVRGRGQVPGATSGLAQLEH